MNMTTERYPNAGAYVRKWRKIKQAPDEYYGELWRCKWRTGVEAKREFLNALHKRINERCPVMRTRMRLPKYQSHYQGMLIHDQRHLHERAFWRVVNRFQTRQCHERFQYLLDEANRD